jgi:SAM-dependent methyltransferase
MTNRTTSARDLAAQAWVDVREPLDRQLFPLGLKAMNVLAPRMGEVVLDIGCGTGQSTIQLAERVGRSGQVIGVDIARQVLDVARELTTDFEQIRFIESDAALLDLPDHSVNAIFSRFGVMAINDPLTAFSNFHRMMKPDGRLAFVCWRSLMDNELDLLPLTAAGLEHLIDPTPFRFEDPARVRIMLEGAGFMDVTIEPDDQYVTSGDLEATLHVLLKVGPLGRIVRENPHLRPDAEPRVRAALAAKGSAEHVALRAATWIVSARASSIPFSAR